MWFNLCYVALLFTLGSAIWYDDFMSWVLTGFLAYAAMSIDEG